MKSKVCIKCGEEKELSEFYKDKSKLDSLSCSCKECILKYHQENKSRLYASHKKYIKKNAKHISEQHSKYCKKYYQLNKEKIKSKVQEYSEKNKEKVLANKREYSKTHKKERSIYYKNRIKNDVNFKLERVLRSRLSHAIKGQIKYLSALDLVDCSVEKLKQHLESQFKEGMTWTNYGKNGWVIDHIQPCVSFDLSKLSGQKKAFHYTNLQPLWEKVNLHKASKIGFDNA